MDVLNNQGKTHVDKLAIFDLDDTLYISNSHIEILCAFYKNEFCKSLIFKGTGRILPSLQRWVMYYFYNKIPPKYKNNFILPFNKTVVNLLEEKKKEGFSPIIVSNAPLELLKNAAAKLDLSYIQTEPYTKASAINAQYHIKELFVCTDNKSDIDLLNLADSAVVICKSKNEKFFKKHLKGRKFQFLMGD